MLISIALSPEQVSYYVHSALNGFDDLDADMAIENARSELSGLLNYIAALSPAYDAVPVLGLRIVDGLGRLIPIGSQAHVNDPANLKVTR